MNTGVCAGASAMLVGAVSNQSRRPPTRWLLLRGLGRERRHWFEFPRLLAEGLGAEVLAVDLPGMGERRAEPVPRAVANIARELMGRLGEPERPFGVLGMSLGGMVALSLASQWPNGISHVVVANGSSRLSHVHERLRPAALATLFWALTRRDVEARERCIYALTTNASPHDVAAWASRAAEFSRQQPVQRGALARQLLAAAAFRPGVIAQPVLVLSGQRDRLVSPNCSLALARELRATHESHPTAGHDLPLEDPAWVLERMRVWLGSVASVTAG